jgi:hypothetical protein
MLSLLSSIFRETGWRRYYLPTEYGARAALVARLVRIEELLGRSDD